MKDDTVEELVDQWGVRLKPGAETCRQLAAGFIQEHKRQGSFVGNTQNKRPRDGGGAVEESGDPVGESVRSFWANISKPNVVATKTGTMVRRATLAAICGPGTKWEDARTFVAGDLSYESFAAAKNRRTAEETSGDIHMRPWRVCRHFFCVSEFCWTC